jgi:hypothetical protein
MSFQIDTAFVKQYHDTIERLLQQRGSKLRNLVRNESQHSEEQFWEQVDKVEAAEVTDRHGDSPLMETPHARRRVTLRQFEVGELIDNFDKVKMLIDPTSVYVQNFVDALGRKVDDEIIDKMLGTAFTGKSGGTSTAFDTTNMQVAVNFGGADSNLTINKLIEARKKLLENHNDPEMQPWYIAVSANNLASLLKTTQVQSADYNTVRALVRGEIDTFLGFKFVHTERLLANAGNVRRVLAWVKDGVMLSVGKDITTEVARRADKRFSWYAYACASFGAVRMQEKKVVEILCDEDL